MKLSKHDIRSLSWDLEMARLTLQDHWGYGLSEEEQLKDATTFIRMALAHLSDLERKVYQK